MLNVFLSHITLVEIYGSAVVQMGNLILNYNGLHVELQMTT